MREWNKERTRKWRSHWKKKKNCNIFDYAISEISIEEKKKRKQPPSHYFQTRFIKQNKIKMIDLWTILLWVNIEKKNNFIDEMQSWHVHTIVTAVV